MTAAALTRSALKDFPLPPVVDGDKESKGRILILAGSRDVPGAALLCATAAMRSGAGKLKIATGKSIAMAVGVAMPEAMVIGLTEHRDGQLAALAGDEIINESKDMDAIVAGPGLAGGPACAIMAANLLKSPAPLVLDAALLHALQPPDKPRASPPILLPHAGELSSLLKCEERDIDRDPLGCGRRAADRFGALVLVKGVTSHVVTPDGRAWTYRGGAPGLGVSGSGDVLAGIVGGLLARGSEPLTALLWSVLLHGEAGERLARHVGPIGFLAREIADELPGLLSC
ncbi:MAG TPA: NAD(P)H-hydrate dehydratase [Sphingomicrobium sp.]|nr:NAD(P)H-hydrate dehydratase [Sphingomicrobium sp.]